MILDTMERRYTLENPNVPIAEGFTFLELMGGRRSVTNKVVTTESALTYSPIWAAVSIIAGHVGAMPLKLYRRRDDGGKDEERGHWVWDFCRIGPNEYMSAVDYQEHAQGHILLKGNCWSELVREGRDIVGAKLLHPDSVKVAKAKNGRMVWAVDEEGERRVVFWEDMLHIAGLGGDGMTGWSVVRSAMESIGQGLSAEEYAGRFYANNARPSGFLSVPEVLKDEAKKNLVESWNAAQGGLENAHRVAVLEGGITWQQMSLSAEESQFLETREHLVRDVARWFNLPIHLLGDRSTSGYNSLTEENMRFLSGTLQRWLVKWEMAIATRLLTPEERQAGLFVEFVREGLLQLDPSARGDFYTQQFNVGAITPNEIRLRENRNPIEGGDKAYIQVNMVPLDQLGRVGVVTEDGIRSARPTERRDFSKRYQLRARYRPGILDAAERLVRGEIRDVSRKLVLLDEPLRWTEWIEDYYYNVFPDFATRTMGTIFDLYGQTVGVAAAEEVGLGGPTNDVGQYMSLYTEGFVRRHARSSRLQLTTLAKEEAEPREAVEQRIADWDEGGQGAPRHEKVADQETVGLGEAVARVVWAAAGVLTLRWITQGDSCPFCRQFNGKIVGISEPFLDAGQGISGAEGEPPMIVKRARLHPPLHTGCDCLIVPG